MKVNTDHKELSKFIVSCTHTLWWKLSKYYYFISYVKKNDKNIPLKQNQIRLKIHRHNN